MRRGRAALVVAAAALLGSLTGAFVLPDRVAGSLGDGAVAGVPSRVVSSSTDPTGPGASPSSAASSSSSATPSRSVTSAPGSSSSAGDGPVSAADLLTADDLAAVGLDLSPQRSDGRAEIVACTDHETLDDVAESGPPAQQFWDGGTVGLTEQAVLARDEDEAVAVVRRVLRRLEACQRRPVGYWLYGPTRTVRLGVPGTARWLPKVSEELNTTGRAPAGAPDDGGVAVLRRGSRVAVLDISWCQSAGDGAPCTEGPEDADAQFVALVRRAADRLG